MKSLPKFASLIALVVMAGVSQLSLAAELPYNQAQFEQLKAEGKPVVIDVFATWCPTCKAQAPSVKAIASDPAFKSVTIFLADFDQEKALKKSLGISQQSTFIVFRDGKEVARSTGQTKKEDITVTFAKALSQ